MRRVVYNDGKVKIVIEKEEPSDPRAAARPEPLPIGNGVEITPLVIGDIMRHRSSTLNSIAAYQQLLSIALFLKKELVAFDRNTTLADVAAEVAEDMRARSEAGTNKYGTPLRAFNGRNAKMDAYQELLDTLQYFRQDYEEEMSARDCRERTGRDSANSPCDGRPYHRVSGPFGSSRMEDCWHHDKPRGPVA